MNKTKLSTLLITPLMLGLLQGCGPTVVNPPGPGKLVVKPGNKVIVVKPNGHRHVGKWLKRCHRHNSLGRHCH